MLKTRILSSVIGLLLLIGAVIISKETLALAIFILSIFGIHEFYSSMSNIGYKPIKPIGYVLCFIILLTGFKDLILVKFPGCKILFISGLSSRLADVTRAYGIILFGIFIFIFILYTLPVFMYGKYNTVDISVTLYGVFYVIFLFMFIVLTRGLEHGSYFVGFIFLGAWATDTFGYFVGKNFGKKKLAPLLSPHKTVEGSVSGIIGSIIIIALYGILLQKYLGYIAYYHYIIIGALCGIISQVGDLVASSTKRYTKIKDYGYIIPGHGGVLDRFDSVLFTAPVVYFYIVFFII